MIRQECHESHRLFDSTLCPGGCEHFSNRSPYHHCELLLAEHGAARGGMTQEEVAELMGWTVREVAAEEEVVADKALRARCEAEGIGPEGLVAVAPPASEPEQVASVPQAPTAQPALLDIGAPTTTPRRRHLPVAA